MMDIAVVEGCYTQERLAWEETLADQSIFLRVPVVTATLLLMLCGTFQSPDMVRRVYLDYNNAKRDFDQSSVDLYEAKTREQRNITAHSIRIEGGGGESSKSMDLKQLEGNIAQAKIDQREALVKMGRLQPQLTKTYADADSASRIIRIYSLGCWGSVCTVLANLWLRKRESFLRSPEFFRSMAGILCGGFASTLVYAAILTNVWEVLKQPSVNTPFIIDLFEILVSFGSGFVADIVFSAVRWFARKVAFVTS
jgi:hypothetical protein